MRVFMALLLAFGGAPAAAQDLDAGEAAYLTYCATCHGVGAKGDGPLTDYLNVPVADLTLLTARSDGEFPLIEVVRTIDGRLKLPGHGGAMPVFGGLLGGEGGVIDGPEGLPVITKKLILDLAEYLRNLQEG